MSIGLMDHQDRAAKTERWKFVAIIGVAAFGIFMIGLALSSIPRYTAEENENLRQRTDFGTKCFAMKGRVYIDPATRVHECYNGPNMVFSKEIK